MNMTTEQAGRMLADPLAYTDEARLHQALALLRREAPVQFVQAEGYKPFFAVTRHADIMAIERDSALWLSEPRAVLARLAPAAQAAPRVKTLVNMDDPDHRVKRAIAADWFRPKAMRALETRISELARRYVDRMAGYGGACDFASQVAVHYPLYVILSLLGLPESDFPRILKLTQEIFGTDDAENQRSDGAGGHAEVLLDFFGYFTALTADRRAHPTDDLASAIANARVDRELLDDIEAVAYYIIIATAGHDTTSSTLAGGLHALLERPDQLDRLRRDPTRLPLAVEEMIRWVTPVKGFMRTASADTSVHGVPIRRGDDVLLSYPSGNRDEDVFPDPSVFDAGRNPNHHLAFGFGAHYCLGAALARLELKAFFAELLPRLDTIDLAGTPQWSATTFVGGLKHLPVRYTLR
jgi:cytochrome P450